MIFKWFRVWGQPGLGFRIIRGGFTKRKAGFTEDTGSHFSVVYLPTDVACNIYTPTDIRVGIGGDDAGVDVFEGHANEPAAFVR